MLYIVTGILGLGIITIFPFSGLEGCITSTKFEQLDLRPCEKPKSHDPKESYAESTRSGCIRNLPSPSILSTTPIKMSNWQIVVTRCFIVSKSWDISSDGGV